MERIGRTAEKMREFHGQVQTGFTIRHTNMLKGLAVLMLLAHHLFSMAFTQLSSPESWPFQLLLITPAMMAKIALYGKACVAIFLFLSGYGLTLSERKMRDRFAPGLSLPARGLRTAQFAARHLLKLYFGFWLIYAIFVALGIAIGQNRLSVYEGSKLAFLQDVLCFGVPSNSVTVNATWWFMKLIVAYYIVFPFFSAIARFCPELCLGLACCLHFMQPPVPLLSEYMFWLPPFAAGIYMAQTGKMRAFSLSIRRNAGLALASLFFLKASDVFRQNWSYAADFLIAFAVIGFATAMIPYLPPLMRLLGWIGVHSSTIFMMHTFLYYYYFSQFIYSVRYGLFIWLLLLGLCLAFAVPFDWCKNRAWKLLSERVFCRREPKGRQGGTDGAISGKQ